MGRGGAVGRSRCIVGHLGGRHAEDNANILPPQALLTDPAPYPSKDNPASYRADSLAGTAARCDAIDAPSVRTGAVLETSAPAAASDCPCANCTASRRRRRF